MANRKIVTINDKLFTLSSFAKEFGFSYTTVRKYYRTGLRDQKLLTKLLSVTRQTITINGHEYSNKYQASKQLGIPKSTFYRQVNKLVEAL